MKTIVLTEQELDNLLMLKGRMVRREIDAGACGTNTDFRKLRAAEEAYDTLYIEITERKNP